MTADGRAVGARSPEPSPTSPPPPLVVSGDRTTSLRVLAGLQRAGHDVAIVWFDTHADFHTEQTTTSGYLGGMPAALAVGVGTLTLPTALVLRPVPPSRALLIKGAAHRGRCS